MRCRARGMMDPYARLGLARGATLDEIRAAFRRLARQHHPDAGGSVEAFAELSGAYTKLTKADQSESDIADSQHTSNPFETFDLSLWSIEPAETQQNARALTLDVPFVVAMAGGQLEVEPGLTVHIPAGARDGDIKHVSDSAGGPVDVTLAVETPTWITRSGGDLAATLLVTPEEAASGAEITVQGAYGALQVKVRAGAHADDILRIRDQGVATSGRLFLTIRICKAPHADDTAIPRLVITP
jgi:DnaJ-class molecular chaperone